jgi:hypothetical protein
MSGNCHFQIKWLDNPEYKKDDWMWEVVRAKQKAHLVKRNLIFRIWVKLPLKFTRNFEEEEY